MLRHPFSFPNILENKKRRSTKPSGSTRKSLLIFTGPWFENGDKFTQDTTVTIAPYFKIKSGQLPAFKKFVERCVAVAEKEPGTLYYGFAFSGDLAFCREGYVNAEAALAHVKHVSPILMEALTISQMVRLEIVGAESELAKMRPHMASIAPEYYSLEYGFRR